MSTVFTLEKCSGLNVEEMLEEVRLMIDGVQTKADGTRIVSSYWSDEILITYLNRAYNWANQILIMNGEGEFGKSIDFDLLEGVSTYPMPNDALRIDRILYQGTGSNHFVVLTYSKDPDQAESGEATGLSINLFTYRLEARNIVFYPTPQLEETAAIRLRYMRGWARLKCDGNEGDVPDFDFLPIWSDVLVGHAVASAIQQNRGNAQDFKEREAELKLMLINFGKPRGNHPQFILPYDNGDEFGLGDYYGF